MDDWITDLWSWPKASEAVGGTIFSHEVYEYQCRECGENHITKEGSPEFCYRDFDGVGAPDSETWRKRMNVLAYWANTIDGE